MAGTDVMTHVKAMILPTGITYVITLIGFGILGAMQYHGGDADMSRVTEFSGALEAVFNINPALLLPPVIVIVAVAMKMPAHPWYHARHHFRRDHGHDLPARVQHGYRV